MRKASSVCAGHKLPSASSAAEASPNATIFRTKIGKMHQNPFGSLALSARNR